MERSFAWLARLRRLSIRYERRADLHLAFTTLACAVICPRQSDGFILSSPCKNACQKHNSTDFTENHRSPGATADRTAKVSLIAPLARGVAKDVLAIRAAITDPWPNNQTEGQITRLKLVKRQMYGRATFDLLEARLIGLA